MNKRYYNLADLIISNIEGGYYSPSRHYSDAMGISGETMFGIDRKHGGAYNSSEAGEKFWAIIDQNSASWAYNYKGGTHETELKRLAAEIIYPFFDKYFKEYLTPKAQKIAKKSDRILLHFFYSCWNGVGWFKKFAEDFNNQVNKTHNISELEKSCILARKNSGNSLIAKGGEKMERMFTMLSLKRGAKVFVIIALLGGAGFGGYKLYNYIKTSK